MKTEIINVQQDMVSTKKRDYSRGGCRECKRRKIKCDETKPLCLRCKKLKKPCSYPATGEKVPRVSKRFLQDNPNIQFESNPKPFTIQVYLGPSRKKKKSGRNHAESKEKEQPAPVERQNPPPVYDVPQTAPLAVQEPISAPMSNISPSVSSTLSNIRHSPDILSTPDILSGQIVDNPLIDDNLTASSLMFDLYNHEDLECLATDLNHIVNDIMFQSNFDGMDGIDIFGDDNSDSIFNSLTVSRPEIATNQKIAKFKTIPDEFIDVTTPDERMYLESFYNGFAMQILPLGSYDNFTRSYYNPIRDTLLKYAYREPYLLAAVLAQGAKSMYESKILKLASKEEISHDQEAYCSYLSRCLKLLGPALTRNREKKVKDDLISNLECILLTVLLLTSANASTLKQNWRPHLKGAKDIILKATNSKIRQSKTLILCKMWFVDFEILAGTSSKFGGTLHTDFELDSVMNFSNSYEVAVLKEFGAIQENGFCIVFGYNIKCVNLFRELIKLLNKKKREGEEFVANDSMAYLNLISGFTQSYNHSYINKEGELSPNFVNNTPTGELPNLIDIVTDGNEKTIVSWMDICQQAYSLASIITIFTQLLQVPHEMPYVQNLNNKLISLISFLLRYPSLPDQHIRYSLLMILWPMMIAGFNCIEEHHRYLLTRYFEFNAELGSSSSEHVLNRLRKLWKARNEGQEYASDVEDDGDVDIVAY